jgi:hypothetical protein
MVFTFFKQTPRSTPEHVRLVQRTESFSEEPIYYPVLDGGHVGLKRYDVIDNPQYTFLKMAEEALPNSGSILCAREIDDEGNVTYFGLNVDGTKGEVMQFPGEVVREKLRTPYNRGQVL